jgi:hypothetical protein
VQSSPAQQAPYIAGKPAGASPTWSAWNWRRLAWITAWAVFHSGEAFWSCGIENVFILYHQPFACSRHSTTSNYPGLVLRNEQVNHLPPAWLALVVLPSPRSLQCTTCEAAAL